MERVGYRRFDPCWGEHALESGGTDRGGCCHLDCGLTSFCLKHMILIIGIDRFAWQCVCRSGRMGRSVLISFAVYSYSPRDILSERDVHLKKMECRIVIYMKTSLYVI